MYVIHDIIKYVGEVGTVDTMIQKEMVLNDGIMHMCRPDPLKVIRWDIHVSRCRIFRFITRSKEYLLKYAPRRFVKLSITPLYQFTRSLSHT